jgi:hypothetical protein
MRQAPAGRPYDTPHADDDEQREIVAQLMARELDEDGDMGLLWGTYNAVAESVQPAPIVCRTPIKQAEDSAFGEGATTVRRAAPWPSPS